MELTRLKANSQYRPCVDEKPYFSWDLKDGKFHIEVDIPCNTTAVVNLPDGSSYKIGSGPYTFDCDVKQ